MTQRANDFDALAQDVRIHVFSQAAATARVPQARDISHALGRSEADIRAALHLLAAAKVLILAPNDGDIWAANPFCAVPSGFRVTTAGKHYWGISIRASCGDCSEPMTLKIQSGALTEGEGIVHFAVPAHHWWDNIGFT